MALARESFAKGDAKMGGDMTVYGSNDADEMMEAADLAQITGD